MRDGLQNDAYGRLPAAARLVRLPPSRVRRYVRAGLVRPLLVDGRGPYLVPMSSHAFARSAG